MRCSAGHERTLNLSVTCIALLVGQRELSKGIPHYVRVHVRSVHTWFFKMDVNCVLFPCIWTYSGWLRVYMLSLVKGTFVITYFAYIRACTLNGIINKECGNQLLTTAVKISRDSNYFRVPQYMK